MWLNYFDAWFRCFCLNQIWVIPSGPCLTSCLKDLTFPMLVDTSHYVGSRYMNCFLFVEQFCTFTCGLLRDWLPRMPCECHFISPRSKKNVCAPSMSPYLTLSCRIWLFTTLFFIWNNMIVCDDKRWVKKNMDPDEPNLHPRHTCSNLALPYLQIILQLPMVLQLVHYMEWHWLFVWTLIANHQRTSSKFECPLLARSLWCWTHIINNVDSFEAALFLVLFFPPR